MRGINVVLDIYSMVISLMLCAYLLAGSRKGQKLNWYFGLMCLLNACMSVGDMSNWLCEGLWNPWNPLLLKVGSLLYYLCACPLLYIFNQYVVEYLSAKTKVNRRFRDVVALACILYIVLTLISQFNGWIYWIDEENFYRRGEKFLLCQILGVIAYGVNMAMIHRYRRYLALKTYFVLVSYIVLPITAQVIQILNYGVALMNPAITITLLIVFIHVQSERELLMKEQEAELAQSRIDIMLSQIKPHFLFNALTVIRQLCDIDPAQAKDAIFDFSVFLRRNMDSLTNKNLIPFEQELSHVEHYLNLEKQRFQERLRVKYEIEEKTFHIPPLTMQPLVENAVRHGITKKDEGGTIWIKTKKEHGMYQITICDDGAGMNPAKKKQDASVGGAEDMDESSHVGIENVRKRLEIMCGGSLEIRSELGKGTSVTLKIPEGRNDDIHIGG